MTMRLYSSMKSSMPRVWGSARAAITELQRPSSASVASCGFKSLRNSPEVRKIVDETSKARGCYSAQVIEIYNKSTAAVDKFGRAGP